MRGWRQFIVVGLFLLTACGDVFDGGGVEGAACSSSNDTCQGDNICISGLCEDAFTRAYNVNIKTVGAKITRPDGSAWDGDNSPPDPFVRVYQSGVVLCQTSVVQNRGEATFNQSCPMRPSAGDDFVIEVLDEDILADDSMFGCRSTLDAETLRKRTLICDTESGKLFFDIKPTGE